MANTKVTKAVLADDAVGLDQLDISNDPSDGQALTYDGSSTNLQWATVSGGVSGISSSADSTAITINSSEQVGIGVSPDTLLHVSTTGSGDKAKIGNGTRHGFIAVDSSGVSFGNEASQGGELVYLNEASGYVAIFQGGSERFRVNDDGTVGIGNTGYSSVALAVNSGTNDYVLYGESTNAKCKASFRDSGSTQNIEYGAIGNNHILGKDGAEQMRIDSSGVTYWGQTSKTDSTTYGSVYINGDYAVGSTNYYAQMFMTHHTATNHGFVIKALGTGGIPLAFQNSSGTLVGSVTTGASSTSFNTSSDHRLKENVKDMTGAITRVKELQPKRFNWIEDETNTLVDGFIAHEASTVVPEAVTGSHNETRTAENVVLSNDGNVFADGVTEDEWTAGKTGDNPKFPSDSTWTASHTFPVYQGIDQAKLVPLLTGALQEAITKIEALEARIETLESN